MQVCGQRAAREVRLEQHVRLGVGVGVLGLINFEGEVHGEALEHGVLAVAHGDETVLGRGAQDLDDALQFGGGCEG